MFHPSKQGHSLTISASYSRQTRKNKWLGSLWHRKINGVNDSVIRSERQRKSLSWRRWDRIQEQVHAEKNIRQTCSKCWQRLIRSIISVGTARAEFCYLNPKTVPDIFKQFHRENYRLYPALPVNWTGVKNFLATAWRSRFPLYSLIVQPDWTASSQSGFGLNYLKLNTILRISSIWLWNNLLLKYKFLEQTLKRFRDRWESDHCWPWPTKTISFLCHAKLIFLSIKNQSLRLNSRRKDSISPFFYDTLIYFPLNITKYGINEKQVLDRTEYHQTGDQRMYYLHKILHWMGTW